MATFDSKLIPAAFMYFFTRFTGQYLLSTLFNVNNVTFAVHVCLTTGDENCYVGVIEVQMTR